MANNTVTPASATATSKPVKKASKGSSITMPFDVKSIQDTMQKLVDAKTNAIATGKTKSTKNPRLVLTAGNNKKEILGQVAISVTKTGKFPGCIYICQVTEDKDSEWIYRLRVDGTVDTHQNVEIPTWINSFLVRFAANPSDVASESGDLSERCCVCNLPLSDERSKGVGYGKICASNMGWAWGEVNESLIEAIKPKQTTLLDPAVVAETLALADRISRTAKLALYCDRLKLDLPTKNKDEYESALSIWLDQVGYNKPESKLDQPEKKVEVEAPTPVNPERLAEVKEAIADAKVKADRLKSLCGLCGVTPSKPNKTNCLAALENWVEANESKVDPQTEKKVEVEVNQVEPTPATTFTEIKSESGVTVKIGQAIVPPSLPSLEQARAMLSDEKNAAIDKMLAASKGKKAGSGVAKGLPEYVAPSDSPKTTIKAGTKRAQLLQMMVNGCTQAEAKAVKDDGVKAATRYGYGYRFDKESGKYFLVMPEGMVLKFIGEAVTV